MFFYDSSYLFYALITTAITLYAHFKVKFVFDKYLKIQCQKKVTGFFIAENVLLQNNVSQTIIEHSNSNFGQVDHFDPRRNKIVLSQNVFYGNSVTSAGVAAHEAGHAVQYAKGYSFIKLREKMFPITQLCSGVSIPIVMIGLILPVQFNFIVNFGIMLFASVVFFHLVTLPVELDASHRAVISLENSGYLTKSEIEGAKEVLKAAAFTYLASLFTSFLGLMRLIFISTSRKDD